MKIKHFTFLSLIIVLVLSFLPLFLPIAFLNGYFERNNNNIKTNGLNEDWSRSIDCIGQYVTIDSSNCIYVVGFDVSWDSSLKLLKYDSSGVLLFNKHFEGFYINSPKIKTDSNNNLYLASSYKNQTSQWKKILVKFNSSGDLQWQQVWESEDIENISDIAIDSEDNIYIYGFWVSNNHTNHNIFIIKFNSSGSQLWYHILEESSTYINAFDIEIDSDNNCVVSGSSIYNQSTGWYWLRCYNISGGLQWTITRQFASFPLFALDSLDNAISIALTIDMITYDRHLVLVKYDNSGNSAWNHTFESKFTDLFYEPVPTPMIYQFDLTLDSFDNIYIAWNIEIPNDLYTTDILMIKINKSGDFEWYLTWGGSDYDCSIEIDTDSNGNIYLLTDQYLIRNPISNGKSLYRTNIWNFYLTLFGICCFISVISLYFILKQRMGKISRNYKCFNAW